MDTNMDNNYVQDDMHGRKDTIVDVDVDVHDVYGVRYNFATNYFRMMISHS